MTRQHEMRNRICNVVMAEIGHAADVQVALTEAATACMGAAAVCLGALPVAARRMVADGLAENLLRHADKRARELRTGQFDLEAQRHAN